jgi:phosphatidylserine/phosphatidylglycerophosphate/cardiolipin synthase-like enzyme
MTPRTRQARQGRASPQFISSKQTLIKQTINKQKRKMKFDKHSAFSIALLVAVFVAGFFIAFLFFRQTSWNCKTCDVSNAEISVTSLLNRQYFNATREAIAAANSSISIVMYQMKSYETESNPIKQLQDELIKAAKRGVKVRVLLDKRESNGKLTALSKENEKTAAYLRENGIDVKLDSLRTTTHTKLVIIDNAIVIVGSHNWSFSAMQENNEASLLIANKELATYYSNYFEFLWQNA